MAAQLATKRAEWRVNELEVSKTSQAECAALLSHVVSTLCKSWPGVDGLPLLSLEHRQAVPTFLQGEGAGTTESGTFPLAMVQSETPESAPDTEKPPKGERKKKEEQKKEEQKFQESQIFMVQWTEHQSLLKEMQ